MANTNQVLDLKGIHHEMHVIAEKIIIMNEINTRLIQHLAINNPLPATAPVLENADRSRHSHRSSDQDLQNLHNAGQWHSTRSCQHQLPSLHSRRGRSPGIFESQSSSRTQDTTGEETRRHRRSPCQGDRVHRRRDKSTTQKFKDLDARIDAINTSVNAPVTVDTLISQTEPPFIERVMKVRVLSRLKLPSQVGVYKGKTNPMDHLDSYKNLMMLQGCSNKVMCKAFFATL